MCRSKSVAYFAHDPAHRLLPASGDGDTAGGGGEFTCHGCLVAGAGRRYRCGHPGCGFTLHESCARRFPRTLKSAVHPQHRLRRRPAPAATALACRCEVCGEDVKGARYVCAPTSCGVAAMHPLCARLPASARGAAHAGGGHEAWLVFRASSSSEPAPGEDGKKKAAVACAACGGPVGAWRYRCVTCREELHPRCLVPAADQCRGGGGGGAGDEDEEPAASRCCAGLLHDLTRCVAVTGFGFYYHER